MHCNHDLCQYITTLIGDEYKTDATKLKDLLKFVDDETVLNKLLTIKQNRKQDLCNYLNKTMHMTLNQNSIIDNQIKR